MLKWTKRAEPSTGSGDAGSKLTNLMLTPHTKIQSNSNHRLHARRSLGNLSRPSNRTATRERQRKSLGSEISRKIQHNRDKENQVQLTPHPNGFRQNVSSTPVIAFGSKMEHALRDVRNITPKQQNSNSLTALLNAMTPSRKRPLAKTPPSSPNMDKFDRVICSSPKDTAIATGSVITQHQTPYASTLPTFDVEYSPCGATQTTILQTTNSIASIAVTDSYFNQRYFQQQVPSSKRLKFSPTGTTPISSRLSEIRFSRLKFGGSNKKSSAKKSDKNAYKEFNVANIEHSVELMTVDSNDNNNLNNNNDKNKNNNECLIKKPMTVQPEPKFQKPLAVPSSEASLSSSALDDTALDKMIDAILESARKERPNIGRHFAARKMQTALMQQINSDSPTYTPAEDPASDLNKFCDNFQISPDELITERTIILEEPHTINEREVKTPESLESRKCNMSADKVSSHHRKSLNCHLRRQRAVRRKNNTLKGDHSAQQQQLKLKQDSNKAGEINGSQSETNVFNERSDACIKRDDASNLSSPKTPTDSDFVLSSFFSKKTADELANMNTPVIDATDCPNLTYAQQPHCGITSITSKLSSDSTPVIHTNDLQASSTPTNIETVNSIRRCLTFSDSSPSSGSSTTDDSLEKRKSTASSTSSTTSNSSNAVCGSLELSISCHNNKISIHVIRCRDLSRPNGDHVNAYVKVALLSETNTIDNGFQRTAVHRNSHRPHFDHRFTFDLANNEKSRIQLVVWHRDREYKRSEFLGCVLVPVKSILASNEINGIFRLQPKSCLTVHIPLVTMCESAQTSVDEAINMDDLLFGGSSGSVKLSKKAIYQRDADENLHLRFLELDLPAERNAISSQKQQSRTPFTMTKLLNRTDKNGFGFSIVWTHPPRIENVEADSAADRCGIYPGDYLIFVGQHNVVTMPEIDILNLIKAQENMLILEIFRSGSNKPEINSIQLSEANNLNIEMYPSHAQNNVERISSQLTTSKQSTSSMSPRPITTCSNISVARLHVPQVTFSKEVGCGVIV